MIRSRTYNGAAGFNYIEASELLYTTVYAVKREGTQYDRYNSSGSSNRTYIYANNEGRIYFPVVFNESGEKVFIIYKGKGQQAACNAASLGFSYLPPGKVGIPYVGTIIFTGSLPMNITGASIPSWATLNPTGSAVQIEGTPDVEGTANVSFNVENCGASLPYSDSFEIGPVTTNLNVSNISATGAIISGVSGISYSILSGSFPVAYSQLLTGSHGNYLGVISVNVTSVAFPCTLSIYKNGVLQQAKSVTTSGIQSFTPFTIFTANTINIVLS